MVILSGFVSWTAPNVYLAAFLVIIGLAVNVVLFRRAEALKPPSAISLLTLSLALSAVVLGTMAYMAS